MDIGNPTGDSVVDYEAQFHWVRWRGRRRYEFLRLLKRTKNLIAAARKAGGR